MGEEGLGGWSRGVVTRGRRRGGRKDVDIRGVGVGRAEGFPKAIPESAVGLGSTSISTEPEERRLSVTQGKALWGRAERLPERGGPVA